MAFPWIAHSKTSCVAECKAELKARLQMSCRNVLYNSLSSSCIPVDLYADNPSSFTLGSIYGDVVYAESPTCDTAAGFQLYQTCEASYCLFIYSTTLNYLGAKADCEARNAVIFVSNSLEKYELLETITSGNTWIAMTKNAGTWVWENGDLVSPDFLQTVWGWDQPDNYHDDKCAVHLKSYPSPKTLFDIPCPHYYFNHVCEQNY